MTDQARPRRASYVLHIVSIGGTNQRGGIRRVDVVLMLDRVLDLFDEEARFNAFTLDGQVALIEDYLTIRPENFERIEQAVQQGKLLVGPWYKAPLLLADDQIGAVPVAGSIETTIRNLMIGMETSIALGRPTRVGYLLEIVGLPPYMPQILRSFGIDTALLPRTADDDPTEAIWQGIDGSRVVVGRVSTKVYGSIPEFRHALAPFNRSGHLLMPLRLWTPDIPAYLRTLPAAQVELHDSVFHSSPAAYTQALQTYARSHQLPVITSDQAAIVGDGDESALTRLIEPFALWSELEAHSSWFPSRPQRLIQNLWRDYLKHGLTEEIRQLAEEIKGHGVPTAVESSDPAFTLLAAKLPDDERDGMIVRGVNTTGDDVWVTLTPWRPFAVVETVTMDEAPTGGKLALAENGATRFKAGPHRIITLWFHD